VALNSLPTPLSIFKLLSFFSQLLPFLQFLLACIARTRNLTLVALNSLPIVNLEAVTQNQMVQIHVLLFLGSIKQSVSISHSLSFSKQSHKTIWSKSMPYFFSIALEKGEVRMEKLSSTNR
jgi:hypothetical protein